MATTITPRRAEDNRLVTKLLAVVAVAFAFGFALVPLYDVLCSATGLNGKTKAGALGVGGIGSTAVAPPSQINLTRIVTVEFTGTVMPGLPWEMRPLTASLDLHPGELHQARFLVHNRSDTTIVGQAVPSVSPGQAAQHFEKLDCFCFTRQTLAPGETRELPLTFIVKPAIDAQIRTVTLSYAFFNIAGDKPAAPERE
ncbi:MAG: cytochrome c oxidase assembly protein [Rhodocyclaceae bacterium]